MDLMGIYTRQVDIVWRDEGEGSNPRVILMVTDMIHQLNEVGSRVWLMCDGNNSLNGIIENIAKVYDAKKEVVTSDVENFVADLADKKWLVNAST